MLAVCCLLEAAFLMRFEIIFPHQTGYAVAAGADAIFLKVMPDTRRSRQTRRRSQPRFFQAK